MRGFKRIAVLLVAGFLAFAPPGTLIFGLLLVLGLVKNFWARLALLAFALLALAGAVARRRRARRPLAEGGAAREGEQREESIPGLPANRRR